MGLSTALFRMAMKGHIGLYRRTRGRLGSMKGSMLLLTTTGRRSGKQHTVPLMGLDHEDGFLIAASAGGDPHHPAWYLNLRDNPQVTVQRGAATIAMTACIADVSERPALWERFKETSGQFAKYETRTDREIPVVILEPR